MDLAGKKVTLVGLGRSSTAAARLLAREGALPFITDSGCSVKMNPWIAQCRENRIPFETGEHTVRALDGADLLVLSPGVGLTNELPVAAMEEGIPVTGELEMASRFVRSRLIALTGTNGKTTTTELLRAMIVACGKSVALAGNNDSPLSLVALEPEQPEFVVVEVSSYQLETAERFHPWIAAVLNLTPDHLARHGTMDGYAETKARIFSRQIAGDISVLNADDPHTSKMPTPAGVDRIMFSTSHAVKDGAWVEDDRFFLRGEPLARLSDNPLPGGHNVENVLAALTMLAAGRFDGAGLKAGLCGFRGVEHRIEHVLEDGGVDIYNDSKSTNVDSLRVALASFTRPLILIAGGRGKEGADYTPLRELFASHVKHLIATGEEAERLVEAFGDLVPHATAAGMDEAVRMAREVARAGDVLLLSPGCASFDWYGNFEERGRDFKRAVRDLCGGAKTGEQPS